MATEIVETRRLIIQILSEPDQRRAKRLLRTEYSAECSAELLRRFLEEEFDYLDSTLTDSTCAPRGVRSTERQRHDRAARPSE